MHGLLKGVGNSNNGQGTHSPISCSCCLKYGSRACASMLFHASDTCLDTVAKSASAGRVTSALRAARYSIMNSTYAVRPFLGASAPLRLRCTRQTPFQRHHAFSRHANAEQCVATGLCMTDTLSQWGALKAAAEEGRARTLFLITGFSSDPGSTSAPPFVDAASSSVSYCSFSSLAMR
jgi:hypothetical protein